MNISVEDVALMHNIISVVIKRGAIEAKEMTLVGKFFDRLQEFLEEHKKEETKKQKIKREEKESLPRKEVVHIEEDSDSENVISDQIGRKKDKPRRKDKDLPNNSADV